jgi:hypothetical protein
MLSEAKHLGYSGTRVARKAEILRFSQDDTRGLFGTVNGWGAIPSPNVVVYDERDRDRRSESSKSLESVVW